MADTNFTSIATDNMSSTEAEQRHFVRVVTLGTAVTEYVCIPTGGNIVQCDCVISGALTTADETITLKNAAGTNMTGGVITITQSGSAAGDVDTVTPTANNSFAESAAMQIAVGGENGAARTASLTFTLSIT